MTARSGWSLARGSALTVVALTLNVILAVALLSYHPDDPSFFAVSVGATANEDAIHNLVAVVGSYTAGTLFGLFGLASWLVPLMLFVSIARWWTREATEDLQSEESPWVMRASVIAKQLLSMTLFVVAITGLCEMAVQSWGLSQGLTLPQGPGGVVGGLISLVLVPLIGFAAAPLLFAALLVSFVGLYGWHYPKIWAALLNRVTIAVGGLRARSRRPAPADVAPVFVSPVEPEVTPPKRPTPPAPVAPRPPKRAVAPPPPKRAPRPVAKAAPKPASQSLTTFLEPQPINDQRNTYKDTEVADLVARLEATLDEYRVPGHVTNVDRGPVVIRFEVTPGAGVKWTRIREAAPDIARSLGFEGITVTGVVPGSSAIGIEVPDRERAVIRLRALLERIPKPEPEAPLKVALGLTVLGDPIVLNLAHAPHLLIGGTTGSGKSVGIHALLVSLLIRSDPSLVRLILIDPKQVEMAAYRDVPHLIAPVITETALAGRALTWASEEMERRLRRLAENDCRDVNSWNQRVADGSLADEDVIPFILVVVDEFGDLVLQGGKAVELQIVRIAQKARAAGIHLLLATQRPSADIVTSLIRSNLPSRIAFKTASSQDSRIILDEPGAESLLGKGDLLYKTPETGGSVWRGHSAFVSENEVHDICSEIKKKGKPQYIDEVTQVPETTSRSNDASRDERFDEVKDWVMSEERVSTTAIQNRFNMGYLRSVRIIEHLEKMGIVEPQASGGQKRRVLTRHEEAS